MGGSVGALAPAVPLSVLAETDFTAVQRAGAKCPVRCADGESVVAVEVVRIMVYICG